MSHCTLHLALSVLVAVAASNVAAQVGKNAPHNSSALQHPKWEEPTSFLGLKFGEKVELPPCAQARNELCKVVVDNFYSYRNLPDLGFKYSLSSLNLDGVPYYFALTTEKANHFRLVAMFRERYGEPIKTEEVTVQTRGGARYTSNVRTWEGPKIKISLHELGAKVTESAIYVTDKDLAEKVKDRETGEAKSKAGAL
ncbi:hypothetical protein [Cupriavidus alkaliphilus]|uniref:hypothetical protein n=1 Tax=Cupriavidus alkaliphilus TaxID=942866 RepID=UPI00161FA9F0|nr:hypothetical protein [Cupriavidus alkaliphilus]MBB2918317.1 hypothetical protein [Cupriavidus alkaliphilus]